MCKLNFDPTELQAFTSLMDLIRNRVLVNEDGLLVSDGEIHWHLNCAHGKLTISRNDRDVYQKNWIADLTNESDALRWLLVQNGSSFRKAKEPMLGVPFRIEELPARASVRETIFEPPRIPPRGDELFIDGRYVGTFKRSGSIRDAVTAAHLLPLTLDELAAIFRDTTRVTL